MPQRPGRVSLFLPALAAGALVVSMSASSPATAERGLRARNVIFVNGDGMGLSQREAARLFLEGFEGELAMDSLPVTGLESTDSRDPVATITDSAAAASAWATGEKTYNGAISVDVDGNPLPVLGAQAKQAGKATGLVTTAQVTDATPAAFFARTAQRGAQDEIARQFVDESRPDVVLGGGEDWWLPAGTPGAYPDAPPDDPSEGSRGTKGNLVERAQTLGYDYVTTGAELASSRSPKLLGLFANQEMFQQRPEGFGDEYDPVVSLRDMTRKALQTLQRDRDGFFLLVEEEAVDEMSHSNNGARTLQSMAALEETVTLLRDYVRAHPDTLLIVAGDHETGGLAVEDPVDTDESGTAPSAEDGPFPVAGSDKVFHLDWTTTGHTGGPTPVTAVGPGSLALTGYYPNTHVYDVMAKALLRRR
jgi:alkaline phosphatase